MTRYGFRLIFWNGFLSEQSLSDGYIHPVCYIISLHWGSRAGAGWLGTEGTRGVVEERGGVQAGRPTVMGRPVIARCPSPRRRSRRFAWSRVCRWGWWGGHPAGGGTPWPRGEGFAGSRGTLVPSWWDELHLL